MSKFLSTPSARRATRALFARFTKIQRFLSTPSARRATGSGCEQSQKQCYFYPRPPRGGRQPFVTLPCCSFGISIHALREEGDRLVLFYYRPDWKFLSTPSARRATKIRAWKAGDDEFLSTPSARRATMCSASFALIAMDFYPRPPRGGRLLCFLEIAVAFVISIHALREEGDLTAEDALGELAISIHALREEGDVTRRVPLTLTLYFYPRPPRGGRPSPLAPRSTLTRFLSTPSARRATPCRRQRPRV